LPRTFQVKKPFEEALLKPLTFYAEHTIQTRLGVRATRVDPRHQMVELEAGDRIHYDKVLVATGVRNRSFRLPSMELEGIYDLCTVVDAYLIRAESAKGRRVCSWA